MQKTVLIVEDNELNMKLFNDLLEAHGYATLKTGHGIEAMELARAHKPDLILMDIQLPEVSGLEVTRWLKQDEELKAIPVIAVTAFAMKGDEERIRRGRLRGLSFEADLGREIHRDRQDLPRCRRPLGCSEDLTAGDSRGRANQIQRLPFGGQSCHRVLIRTV